jgi:hypothetical protein
MRSSIWKSAARRDDASGVRQISPVAPFVPGRKTVAVSASGRVGIIPAVGTRLITLSHSREVSIEALTSNVLQGVSALHIWPIHASDDGALDYGIVRRWPASNLTRRLRHYEIIIGPVKPDDLVAGIEPLAEIHRTVVPT